MSEDDEEYEEEVDKNPELDPTWSETDENDAGQKLGDDDVDEKKSRL